MIDVEVHLVEQHQEVDELKKEKIIGNRCLKFESIRGQREKRKQENELEEGAKSLFTLFKSLRVTIGRPYLLNKTILDMIAQSQI